MKILDIPLIARDEHGERKITPTDVAQLIRFEQCERFLRLQLHGRNADYGFLSAHHMQRQGISPLLNVSGSEFEAQFETALDNSLTQANHTQNPTQHKTNFGSSTVGGDRRRLANNQRVAQIARELPNGHTHWLLQPRIVAHLNGWQLRGDLDLLRFERDENGRLHVLIADMKSSSRARHEHKLQIAFYHHMMSEVLGNEAIAHQPIEIGIAYRGPRDEGKSLPANEREVLEEHQKLARKYLQVDVGYYDPTPERAAFFGAVDELVLQGNSLCNRIADTPNYHDLEFHLGYKCDGCNFNEWCLKTAAQDDDLSVLPHLDEDLKRALRKAGIGTVTELAALKRLRDKEENPNDAQSWNELAIVPEHAALVQRLAATRGLGSRLDELIHRALAWSDWRARESGLPRVPHKKTMPSKGYGSLPFCSAEHNPNLVKIFIDTQFDYLQERLYGVSALVVAFENGVEARQQSHVHLCDAPPENEIAEKQLLAAWIDATLKSVVELAAPNAGGELRAPIHLIFFNKIEQKTLLEALGRHFSGVVAATPLYDFVTQIAALDGAMVSFLDEEMRELKNYPRTCANLHEIAQITYDRDGNRFDWNQPRPFKTLFRERVFDGWGKIEHLDDGEQWVQSRARFSSHLPLEYAYAAWQKLPAPKGEDGEFASYRTVTRDDWLAFQARRLDAIKHIADSFAGNKQTAKSEFDLSKVHLHEGKANNLAQALAEFLILERHATLGGWKQARLAPPERRALAGETLVCKYLQSDQTPENQELNTQNAHNERELAAWREENPGERKPRGAFPTQYELTLRLRLETAGSGISAREVLALSSLREGDLVVIAPRWEVDSRLPKEEQTRFTPTPKQLLYRMRVEIVKLPALEASRDDSAPVWIEVRVLPPRSLSNGRGWVFAPHNHAFENEATYSLDSEPNDWHGVHQVEVVEGLVEGEPNALYARLQAPQHAEFSWPDAARLGQEKFLAGLNALSQSDKSFVFETSKQKFIGAHGSAPFLLVQGPPGTGKSYASAWALWARLQGALASGRDFRVVLCCKTHAATDVLLRNLRDARARLEKIQQEQPALFAQFFEARLFEIPLIRFDSKRSADENEADAGIELVARKSDQEKGEIRADKLLQENPIGVFAATPGGVYRLCKDAGKTLFEHRWFDMLVIDEASQMSLPEAMMASLPLREEFALVVVGDPRQMPPIVKNDWQSETRRTFQEFKAFASLYDSIAVLDDATPTDSTPIVARIAFEESFRLHRDMAEFLRSEIYAQDGIRYHSHRLQVLAERLHDDPFVSAVLNPQHSLIVITHDESSSVLENVDEARLIRPLLEALSHADGHGLDGQKGLGIVVPHRAQRALLQDARWYVETVEKFQGDERLAMLFCATESDRAYLSKGGFLFDPRRLNVALSRAKHKMILVAGQTVFSGFHADEETFNNAQLWKNLLRHTCNQLLWSGERDGLQVEVWGNNLSLGS